jgi:galactokinase/CTP:molybdopterin cytidylyltransferase MocA
VRREELVRFTELMARFEGVFGEGEVGFATAPARINIIGEHIDYVEYFKTAVLPFASAQHTTIIALRLREDRLIKAHTLASGYPPSQFSLDEFIPPDLPDPQDRWMAYLARIGVPKPNWINYIKASAFYLQNLHPDLPLKGMDLMVDSTIPPAGGASSSSALVVASGIGMRAVNGMKLDMDELAESSSQAEWFVGTRGGKMDHATMCFARENHALLISFHPFSAELIPMPVKRYRWVTFYAHPADKGDAVMSEYNERSVVSKFIVPMLLERALSRNDSARVRWEHVLNAIASRDEHALKKETETIEAILSLLPSTITLREFLAMFGEIGERLRELYPVLFQVRGINSPLKIRDRARHHLGEIGRVISAADLLRKARGAELEGDEKAELDRMAEIGGLLNETHRSLRDLYEVSTERLERLVEIVRECDDVLGARVMGGGFGGNVLTLVRERGVEKLIEKVRRDYYSEDTSGPSFIMISTPGDGSRYIPPLEAKRMKLIMLANDPVGWGRNEEKIQAIVDELLDGKPSRPIRPIIIVAGKGVRARRSGLKVPKPLAPVFNTPVVRYVLDKFLALPFPVGKPVVVVSPEVSDRVREVLAGYEVDYAVQKRALGTANAVLAAREALDGFDGDVAVIWGTQPVVRVETIEKSILIHQAARFSSMTFPTVLRSKPYAPIVRDDRGWVVDSLETHLEGAEAPEFGEDNVGFFVLPSEEMFEALEALHRDHYLPEGRYDTPRGELGFPNMMVRWLAGEDRLILALAMADFRETKGIKTKEDLEIVERYISELSHSLSAS